MLRIGVTGEGVVIQNKVHGSGQGSQAATESIVLWCNPDEVWLQGHRRGKVGH